MWPFFLFFFSAESEDCSLRARTITGFLIPWNEPLSGLYISDLVLRGTRGGWPVYSAPQKTQVRSNCRLVKLLVLEKALACSVCIAWNIIS